MHTHNTSVREGESFLRPVCGDPNNEQAREAEGLTIHRSQPWKIPTRQGMPKWRSVNLEASAGWVQRGTF